MDNKLKQVAKAAGEKPGASATRYVINGIKKSNIFYVFIAYTNYAIHYYKFLYYKYFRSNLFICLLFYFLPNFNNVFIIY